MTQTRPAPDAKSAETAKSPRPPSNVLPLNFDLLGVESIKKELQKLAATNQEILKAFQERPAELPVAKPKDFGSSGNIVLPPQAEEMAALKKEAERLKTQNDQYRRAFEQLKGEVEKAKKENDLLRKHVVELGSKLQADTPTAWKEQQREFDQLLQEKTEVIRRQHMQIQELQDALQAGPAVGGVSTEELERKQQELLDLEQRLLSDQDSLGRQAREMEMSMAKERAELARQRAEIQRLQTDLQREMELASRDPGLRERLANLQRRPDGRPRTVNSLPDVAGAPTPPPRRPVTMQAINLDDPAAEDSQKPGLFRRLFGG